MLALNSNAVYKQTKKPVKVSKEGSSDKLTFSPLSIFMMYRNVLGEQKFSALIQTSTTAFRLGIRHWGKCLHRSLFFSFFFTCINLCFPFFRCVHLHTLLCLAEFHSNMMLLYAPYSDDLATPNPAGACPWPWDISQSLLVPLAVHLIFKFIFF